MDQKPNPGAHVRYTGTYIRSRDYWTVQACACKQCASGKHVALDEIFYGGTLHAAIDHLEGAP